MLSGQGSAGLSLPLREAILPVATRTPVHPMPTFAVTTATAATAAAAGRCATGAVDADVQSHGLDGAGLARALPVGIWSFAEQRFDGR
mmetsp:Transcript_32051/g.73738  ORF Transcript_32051/g.73738 Transcript_32051/m.73738 type:complete len:88 (-) Transcript_32051:1352-1615(-)